ncbi:hypothetical protein AUK22_01795 [bacterium CG2_30_54_10]|nr:MAG: hypothetical protein AUK22_01795 [bacterium CG2_30_54_10]
MQENSKRRIMVYANGEFICGKKILSLFSIFSFSQLSSSFLFQTAKLLPIFETFDTFILDSYND